MSSREAELAKRVAVAVVGIPIALAFAYLGGFWLSGFLGLLAAVAAWEFFTMNRSRGVASFGWTGALLALGFVLLAGPGTDGFVARAAVFALALAAPAALIAPVESRPAIAASVTVFGALYTGGMLAFAVWLRSMDASGHGWRGVGVLFFPVALTWLGDTAAYGVGRAIGRHRLAPRISPGKTWEGAVAGLAGAVGAALAYVHLTRPVVEWTLSVAAVIGFGALIGIAGQVGDLVESRFKRDCGVKDSSRLLPGHGGILDRLDSLLFVFPVSYAYLRVVGI